MGMLSKRWDLFEKAPQLVTSRFDDMKAYAIQGYNMAMSSIQALVAIAGSLSLINKPITIDTTPIIVTPLPDFPTPIAPVIDMDEFRVDFPTQPTEPTLIDAQLGTLPTTFPELVGPGEVNAGESVYVSDLMTALKNKIMNDLYYGSTGMTPAVEDALFKRNYERDILEYEDEQDRIGANWAKGGFPYPNGGLRAAQDKATMEFSNKRVDVSRDIMIKSWEIALQNSHFIIAQGIAIEALFVRWAESVATRALDASKAAIEKNLKTYDSRVKGFGEKARIIIEECKAKIEYNLGRIRMYEASVNAYSSKMRAEAERINAVARGDEAQVSVFDSIVGYDTKKADLELKVIDAKIQQAVANANILVKDKDVEIRAYEALMSLKAEAEKAIGAIAAQVAAGSLSAVHAQVHIGADNSATYSARSGELLLTDDLP